MGKLLLSLRVLGAILWIYSLVGGLIFMAFLESTAIPFPFFVVYAVMLIFVPVRWCWVLGPLLYGATSLPRLDLPGRLWIAGALAMSAVVRFFALRGHIGHGFGLDRLLKSLVIVAFIAQGLAAYFCLRNFARELRNSRRSAM